MGNHHSTSYSGFKPRKNVHWKTAEKPGCPGKPEIIPIASEDEPNAVTLKWTLPKHDGGAPLQGFQVECNRIGTPAWIHTSPPIITKPELILTGLEAGFRYQFRVSAVNAVSASDPSELSDILTISSDRSALTPPKFLTKLDDFTSLENETSQFRVAFDGVPPPTIAWFKDGFEIFSSRRTVITTEDNSSVLIFHETLLSDEGEIKCTATNRAGHAVTKARLSLEAAPKLRYPRQYEDGLLYEINETIFLKTSLVGKPAPDVEWRHDGQLLVNDERIEISNTAKFSILRIHSAQRSDRGEYQIHASNSIGEDTAGFLVTITAPPDPPRGVTVTRQVDKSVALTWSPPEDDGGCRIGNYVVEYYRNGWNVWLKATTSRKLGATLFDLIEGSEYKFRVKAESPYGMSEPSEESAAVRIPGKSVDMDFLAIESRIITDMLVREDGEEIAPAASPRRKRSAGKKESKDRSGESLPEASEMMEVRKSVELRQRQSIEDSEPVVRRRKILEPPPDQAAHVNSTEFMLVLCPDGEKSITENRKSFQFDLEDSLSPPPISFSAPELGTRGIPFTPIRNSVSSTELLHERAMDRFYKAVAMKEELKAKKDKEAEIPKRERDRVFDAPKREKESIYEAAKRENETTYEISTNTLVPQKPAIEKYQIKSETSPKIIVRPDIIIKSDSVESRESKDSKQQSNENIGSSQNLEVKQVNRWQSTSFDDDYTASTVSTDGSEERSDTGSLDGYMERHSDLMSDEEFTYNPRDKPIRSSPEEDDKAVEILSKPAPLPDPNFIPKPILKRRENEPAERSELDKKHEKMTIFKKITKMPVSRSFPFAKKESKKEIEKLNSISNTDSTRTTTLSKDQLNAKDDKELDEGRIVIEHYGNIVKEFGSHKRPSTPLYLNTEDLKKVAEKQQEPEKTIAKTKQSKLTKLSKAPVKSKQPSTSKTTTTSKTLPVSKVPPTLKAQTTSKACVKSKVCPKSNSARADPQKPAIPQKLIKRQRSTEDVNTPLKQEKKSPPIKTEVNNTDKQVALKKTARATIVIPIDYEELEQQARVNVRSAIDYTVDVCLLLLAFWFYFFKDERLAIPFLILIIYRQIQEATTTIPLWIKRYTPSWMKSKNS